MSTVTPVHSALFILSNAAGKVAFEVAPFNTHQVERVSRADYSESPLVGKRPPINFAGEGAEEITLKCRIFPEALGGLGELGSLERIQRSGAPAHLLRGDGVALGWFGVTSVSELHTYLAANGVGRVIDIEVSLKRSWAPSAEEYTAAGGEAHLRETYL